MKINKALIKLTNRYVRHMVQYPFEVRLANWFLLNGYTESDLHILYGQIPDHIYLHITNAVRDINHGLIKQSRIPEFKWEGI